MINSKMNRVFYHELGHFIAHSFVFDKYEIYKVESISIEYKKEANDYIERLHLIQPKTKPELSVKKIFNPNNPIQRIRCK